MDCLFCKIIAGEIASKIIRDEKDCVAFEDVNPQAPVHILIVPRKHIATINDLQADADGLTGKLIRFAKEIAIEKNIDKGGYRLVLNCNADAGQTVFHLHLHLLGGRKFRWPPG